VSGCSGVGILSSSSSSDKSEIKLSSSEPLRSSSEMKSSSLSVDDSVQVDGSYSCLRGEDERRLVFHPGRDGVKVGVFEPFRVTGLADRCGGGGGGASSSSSSATF